MAFMYRSQDIYNYAQLNYSTFMIVHRHLLKDLGTENSLEYLLIFLFFLGPTSLSKTYVV